MTVMINKQGGRTVLHFTANGSANLVGNSTTSDIALGDEVINSASITQIWYGVAPVSGSVQSYWNVARGSNTVAILSGTDRVDYAGHGASLILDNTGNISVTLNNTAIGYIMIEIAKQGNKGSQG